MNIVITDQDIQDGECWDACKCPVALALKREFPEAEIVVCHTTCVVDDTEYPLPDEARKWILDFDLEKPVAPIQFTIAR